MILLRDPARAFFLFPSIVARGSRNAIYGVRGPPGPTQRDIHGMRGPPGIISLSPPSGSPAPPLGSPAPPPPPPLPPPSGSVSDLADLQTVLRSNGWPADTLSPSPWEALSARGDLSPNPDDRDASGAYDCKVCVCVCVCVCWGDVMPQMWHQSKVPP